MPFSNFNQLPSLNLQLQRANYQPMPARVPNQSGLLAAQAIASQLIPALVENFSPEGRRKKQEKELDLKLKQLQYNTLARNPYGKTALDDVHRRQAEQSILTNKALQGKYDRDNPDNQPSFDAQGSHLLDKTAPSTEKPFSMPDLPSYEPSASIYDEPIPDLAPTMQFSDTAFFPTTTPEDYWS